MESMSIYDEQNHALMNHKLPSISLLPQLDNQEEYDTRNDSKVATLSHTSPQQCLKPSMSTSSNNSDSSQGHSIPTPSSFLPPPYIHKDHQDMDCTYSNVVSPPLTPAVSPSSLMYDAMHMKRKYSVDVGPFAFSSSMVNQASVAASAFNTDMYQDAYRRHSMCSEMSLDDYTHHNGHHFSMPVPSPQPMGDASKNRRGSTSSGRGTAKPSQSSAHKHVCKYPYCGWSFKRYEHLKRHMLVHTGERPHLCDFPGCGKSFSRSDNFAAHYRTHTKKTLLQHRSSISSIDTMQQQHQQQQHQNNAYFRHNKMPPNFDFTRTYELYSDRQAFPTSEMQTTPEMIQQQHYFRSFESLHPMGSSPFHSSPIGKLEFMHMHQPSSPTSPTEPSDLSSSLQQPDNADVYMPLNAMTSSQQYKTHACQECRKRFKRLEHLKRHMRTHTLERPFSCPVTGCGKSFSRSDNLSQHVKTHQRHQYRERTAAAQGNTAVSSNVWENATTVHC